MVATREGRVGSGSCHKNSGEWLTALRRELPSEPGRPYDRECGPDSSSLVTHQANMAVPGWATSDGEPFVETLLGRCLLPRNQLRLSGSFRRKRP